MLGINIVDGREANHSPGHSEVDIHARAHRLVRQNLVDDRMCLKGPVYQLCLLLRESLLAVDLVGERDEELLLHLARKVTL